MSTSRIYISHLACRPLIEHLKIRGFLLSVVGEDLKPAENTAFPISCHPDILYCHLADGKVFHGNPAQLGPQYPADCIYNACSTGRFFIHNLKITDPSLLALAEDSSLIKIHVSQGYTRCSTLPVDENSIITYDQGIARACREQNGPDVLLVRPGHVNLPGYNCGFIGGCGGRVGNEIVFNGNLSAHPDFEAIKDFIQERGLGLVYFKDEPLTDIGSVIEEVF